LQEPFSLALGLGFLLGLKHAIEADHVVAVTTIVSEQRSVLYSSLVGVFWGIGHTASLFIAGIFVIFLQIAIPPNIATVLEFLVALMIIFLGGRMFYQMLKGHKETHSHPHTHDNLTGRHTHIHRKVEHHNGGNPLLTMAWRPLVVGMIHGLAGSAALTLLVLTEVVKGGLQIMGLFYLLVFGIGSIGGMLLISMFISLPFVFSSLKFESINIPIKFLASTISIIFGFYYAWKIIMEA
jgi:high-affinity nickel permease